ncbi:MAG TPA: HAD family hydrolase, partial [Syntrophales bacterium]
HHLALHHVFEFVITFDDTGERKPSPAGFLKALELLKVEPSEALMVGDWPERDMVGASRLGIRTVFARYGDSKGVAESGADFEVDDILEILEIVERLNAGGTKDKPCSS